MSAPEATPAASPTPSTAPTWVDLPPDLAATFATSSREVGFVLVPLNDFLDLIRKFTVFSQASATAETLAASRTM